MMVLWCDMLFHGAFSGWLMMLVTFLYAWHPWDKHLNSFIKCHLFDLLLNWGSLFLIDFCYYLIWVSSLYICMYVWRKRIYPYIYIYYNFSTVFNLFIFSWIFLHLSEDQFTNLFYDLCLFVPHYKDVLLVASFPARILVLSMQQQHAQSCFVHF
jgi:hypothetical protein